MKLQQRALFALALILVTGAAAALQISGRNSEHNLQILQMGIQAISREEAITAVPSGTITTAYQLTAGMSQVTVVASAGDAVKLPATALVPITVGPKAGLVMTIVNAHPTNAVNIFPNLSTDVITNNGASAAAGAALSLPALKVAECFAPVDGSWFCQIG